MHFADSAKIEIISGKGGDGMISYRREKFIAKGGPNGGNGGTGGNVIFKLNPHLNTLSRFRNQKVWKAKNGENGGTWDKYGKSGEDLILEVPDGTMIKDPETGEIISDITSKNPEFLALEGGRGGYGNAHFTSSVRQCPDFAEFGDVAQEMEVELELKLIADIGIIGFPSVGKSTLISVISNAKPKIAAYHFTTLVPNRGIVDHYDKSLLVCDTPGLIEGASEGKGLGSRFLKHIERTAGLVHLLDATWDTETILENYKIIRNELENHSKTLASKPEMIVINKLDVITEDKRDDFKKEIEKLFDSDVIYISAASHENTDKFLDKMFAFHEENVKEKAFDTEIEKESKYIEIHDEEGNEYLEEIKPQSENKTDNSKSNKSSIDGFGFKVYKPHLDNPNSFGVDRISEKEFQISGERIEQIARMTMWHIPSAVNRVRDVMEKKGIIKELHRLGAKPGDIIWIGKDSFEYHT